MAPSISPSCSLENSHISQCTGQLDVFVLFFTYVCMCFLHKSHFLRLQEYSIHTYLPIMGLKCVLYNFKNSIMSWKTRFQVICTVSFGPSRCRNGTRVPNLIWTANCLQKLLPKRVVVGQNFFLYKLIENISVSGIWCVIWLKSSWISQWTVCFKICTYLTCFN